MGLHRHDDFAAAAEAQEDAAAPAPALVTESEVEFFTRRALEESRLAQRAATPAAASAHRYLAAAYSERLARHITIHSELEDLLRSIP